MANKKTLQQQGPGWIRPLLFLGRVGFFHPLLYHNRREKQMNENGNERRFRAALELLRFKAEKQMCEGKTTCTLNEDDIKEVLFVAGMGINRELEVM